MSVENPYYHRGPIKKATHFYNRTRETARTLQMVKNGQSVSIIGPRRIGKTSLLFHLSDPAVRERNGLAPERALFVYVDGEALGGLAKAEILHVLFQETQAQSARGGLDLPRTMDQRSFEQAMRELVGPERQLVYLIDEFECLSSNPNLDANFFPFLRGLNARYNVAYVTVSLVPLFTLIADNSQLSSRFFNIFMPIRLGLFSQADARQLVRAPSRAAGVEFPAEIEDFILDLAGPHPFFIQIACYHAFELWREDPGFGAPTRTQLERDVQADLESHFEYFVGRLGQKERRVLARLLDNGRSENSTAIVEELARKCLIRRCNDGYALVSRAFAQFVQQRIGTTLAATTVEGERQMATALFADLVGFTRMTEQNKPEAILSIIKTVQRLFVDIVDRHGGKVANFGGDSMLAIFPTGQPGDAARAVCAALEIQAGVAGYAGELKGNNRIDLTARVGLDTDVVVLGEIGGQQRAEYTALGDAVNLAQRLQGEVAQPGDVVISGRTYQQVRGRFRVKSLGLVRLKGKTLPQKAYRVLDRQSDKFV